MIYTMRYRTGSLGVQTGFLEASSQQRAEEVAQAWCNLEPFRKYISVVPAIIADESILNKAIPAAADDAPPTKAPPSLTGRKAS